MRQRQLFAGKSDSTFWNIWQWVIHIWKAMALNYNLAYQEIISVHPTRRQIFAGKSDSTFWNIWQWVTRKLILILWGVPSVVFKGEKYYFRVYVHFQGNANGLEPSWMLPHCIACFFCFWPVFQFNHFPSTARAFVDISCVRKYLDNLEVSNTSPCILLLGTWYLQNSLLPHNGGDQILLNRFCP